MVKLKSGEYCCYVRRADYRQVLGFSNCVTLTVHELFSKPTLTVHPSTTLWEGDTVTLKCQSESQLQEIQLTYKFYKDDESVSQGASESEFRIPSAQPETSGSYWCEVEAEGKKTEKKSSERVQVTVRELFTKPTLTVHPSTTLWQEDNVTLRCQSESRFQGTPLTYKFYRDEEPVSQGLSESEFTIPSARPEKSGSYWCEVEEEGKKTEKKTSERVQVTVRELFTKPTLTVHPSTTLWQEDNVTLRDEEPVSQGLSESEFTIPSARPEKSGSYWCEVGEEGKKTEKKTSERVQVTVRELFTKPTLTVHPSTTLWQEDNVTLRCQSESRFQGTPLTYKFYRDEEPVSQGLSESEFTIPSARPEKSGSYWCEVEEEGKKTEKKTSERVQVTVRGVLQLHNVRT
ncbi:leukocyte immunoglobulin-like receptor subfamily A member 2 [Polypterus senegalus]|uniref:leukocyte immunoglobulin-like receptor subfamily A member 2 n=1 Tax=Polypterus senegalus TaxID=55291 RepID=UPI001965FF71|nr:leukocyte immunoglobulin-like receptor subfamily A member 2 [Polypterus senegalus]